MGLAFFRLGLRNPGGKMPPSTADETSAATLCLRSLRLQSVLRDFYQVRERGVVGGGDIREDLAVQSDLGSLQAFHEAAVSSAGGTSGGIDANLPQRTEGPLLGAAVAERVLAAVIDSVRGVAVKFGTAHPEALGGSDHSCAAFAGSWGVCDSHGSSKKLQVYVRLAAERKVLLNAVFVSVMHGSGATEPATALWILGLEQVPLAGARTQNFARSSDFEPLCRGLLRFDTLRTSHKFQLDSFQKGRAI